MRRPHISSGIAELRNLFEAGRDDLTCLEQLRTELSWRKTRGARDLFDLVLIRLDEIESQRRSPSTAESCESVSSILATNEEPDDAETVGDGLHHPDDQKRPARLVSMRPPGTSGLPDAWQRSLRQDLALPVAADADLPDLFVAAVNALIGEIKRSGSNQKRYELEKGQRLEAAQDEILYAFPFSDEAELFEEAQIELHVAGRRVDGSIVSISAGRLVIALREDLGNQIRQAILVVDTTALLAALVAKIEQVKKGEITLNRELADTIAGRDATPAVPPPVGVRLPETLNHAQRLAFQQAAVSAVTWIWGPPGCGKTKTLVK